MDLLCIHAVANTPAGPSDARVAVFFQRRRPSPADNRVGSRINVFEACSAFTARYGLHTRGVAWRPFTPEASEISLPTSLLRLLPTVATLVGLGLSPTGDPRLPTAHCQLPFLFMKLRIVDVRAHQRREGGCKQYGAPRNNFRNGVPGRRPIRSAMTCRQGNQLFPAERSAQKTGRVVIGKLLRPHPRTKAGAHRGLPYTTGSR